MDECITKRFAMTRKNGLTGVKGHVLKELVYTNQTIVAHHEAEESITNEVDWIKRDMKGKHTWVQNRREGRVWCDDSLVVLDNIAAKTAEKLNAKGINTVGDFIGLTNIELKTICQSYHGMQFK